MAIFAIPSTTPPEFDHFRPQISQRFSMFDDTKDPEHHLHLPLESHLITMFDDEICPRKM